MIISDESVFLSLAIGVAIGFFLVINKVIVAGNRGKGVLVFLSDFTFAVISIVLTFIASIPISKGRIRFAQAALQLIGAMAFYLAFGDAMVSLLHLLSKLWRKNVAGVKRIYRQMRTGIKNGMKKRSRRAKTRGIEKNRAKLDKKTEKEGNKMKKRRKATQKGKKTKNKLKFF